MTKTAQCACGKLSVAVTGDPAMVVACHCSACQRRTGSVFGVGAYYAEDMVKPSGPAKLYVRDAPDGRKMRNYFCPECGTSVYWTTDLVKGAVGVAVGAFCDPNFLRPHVSVWENSKHDWVTMHEATLAYLQSRFGEPRGR